MAILGRVAIVIGCVALLGAVLAPGVEAGSARWLQEDFPVILGYGCTSFELEPFDPRFHCPDGQRVHEAIDFDTPVGTPVHAGLPGLVASIGAPETKDYGPNYLLIQLDDGHDLVLGHLSSASVRSGQRITPGDLLGTTGNLGETNWPNLHFEVRPRGGSTYSSIDPAPYLTLRSAQPALTENAPGTVAAATPTASWDARPDVTVSGAQPPLPTLPDGPPLVLGAVGAAGLVLFAVGLRGARSRTPRGPTGFSRPPRQAPFGS